jgi:hypothetical protein
MPTSSPSDETKRLTICPHGSILFFTSIRYPPDSRIEVAFSTLSKSNSSHAAGQERPQAKNLYQNTTAPPERAATTQNSLCPEQPRYEDSRHSPP